MFLNTSEQTAMVRVMLIEDAPLAIGEELVPSVVDIAL